MSPLTEPEKILIRSTLIDQHVKNELVRTNVLLLEFIEKANKRLASQIHDIKKKLVAARNLKRNFQPRLHEMCYWVPAHYNA